MKYKVFVTPSNAFTALLLRFWGRKREIRAITDVLQAKAVYLQ